MKTREEALRDVEQNQGPHLEDLKDFLRIPSISTLSERKEDIRKAAGWVADQMKSIGFDEVEILPTDGHDVVYGEMLDAGDMAPTILFYGHYDVQPADPIELWESKPFEPTVRGENLYARGASDMKGQIVAHLKAVQAIRSKAPLPVNLKYMIEGEEEIGSPSLQAFIEANIDKLDCQICLNADSSILAPDMPSIIYGLRGLAYFEIRLQGPSGDQHSGIVGGAIDNPANVIAELIAGMRDVKGRITLPGFYDDVLPLSDLERQNLGLLPQDDDWWIEMSGVPALFGEEGYTSTERATSRPTLDVNGLHSGFTGEGSKTVLPSRAMAKISMRLVPDQHPDKVKESLIQYLEENAPKTVTWELDDLAGATPAILEIDSPANQAASKALEQVWGHAPLFNRTGGTVPVVSLLKDLLEVDSLMLGFGLPDDNLHAPNEKLHLQNFYRGIQTYIHLMYELAEQMRSR
jgi:acetylornithine deacetylase/succinyl-diaminopimelate desuccinylase-like protein